MHACNKSIPRTLRSNKVTCWIYENPLITFFSSRWNSIGTNIPCIFTNFFALYPFAQSLKTFWRRINIFVSNLPIYLIRRFFRIFNSCNSRASHTNSKKISPEQAFNLFAKKRVNFSSLFLSDQSRSHLFLTFLFFFFFLRLLRYTLRRRSDQ